MNNKDDANRHILESNNYVNWVAFDHPRASLTLQESPFLCDVYLSISDWSFHIWRGQSLNKPAFISPRTKTRLTGGCWSNTRAGLILLSQCDGSIEIWDFVDDSFSPYTTLTTTPNCITSLEFLTFGKCIFMFLMWIGRLEIIPAIILLLSLPMTFKKKD